MAHITAQDIAEALGRGKEVRQSATSWNTLCPAHNDSSPSFTVSEAANGRILVKCHAGCEQADVIAALREMNLWPRGAAKKTWRALNTVPEGLRPPKDLTHFKFGVPTKRWEYRNRAGQLVGYTYRFDHPQGGKDILPLSFCQAEQDGELAWRWHAFNKPRPLYNEHLLGKDKVPILVVEGEKTADAAGELFPDYTCVTWPGGSNAVRFARWELLKGRDVTIWPDADEPGLKAATLLAEILVEAEVKSVRIVYPPEGLPSGWDLADEVPHNQPFDRRVLVITAPTFEPSGNAVIDKLNQRLALTVLGDKAVVIWEKWDIQRKRNIPKYVGLPAVKMFYANEFVPVGQRQVPIIDYWLTHPARKSYADVVFEPGMETPGSYNLWRGFTFTPEPTGDWSLLEEHLRENVAQGEEGLYLWLIGWFAQMLQNPQHKPGTSVAIRGKQGAGKTVVGQHIGALIRDNYVYVDDPHYVTGNFNSHMAHSLLLHADEAFFAGDPRHIGRLKGMVTSNTNRIEYKGKDSFEINNYQRLYVSSNSDWIMPTAFEERRFAVIDCGEGRLQDRAYFKEMDRQLHGGGYEGLLHYLLNFDLSQVDPGQIPSTAALADQKQHSLNTVARFWFERLRDGEILPNGGDWPTEVSCEDLYMSFIKRAQYWGVARRASDGQFGREVKGFVPGGGLAKVRRQHSMLDERGHQVSRRIWCYQVPSLESCRNNFAQAMGAIIAWDEYDSGLIQGPEKDDIPF